MPTFRGFHDKLRERRRYTPHEKTARTNRHQQTVASRPCEHGNIPRPLGEAFEDIAHANGITKAELLRRLIQALVEKMKTGR